MGSQKVGHDWAANTFTFTHKIDLDWTVNCKITLAVTKLILSQRWACWTFTGICSLDLYQRWEERKWNRAKGGTRTPTNPMGSSDIGMTLWSCYVWVLTLLHQPTHCTRSGPKIGVVLTRECSLLKDNFLRKLTLEAFPLGNILSWGSKSFRKRTGKHIIASTMAISIH